ncbi:M28 family peptidase [Alteromonas ponticola]|uniref:M28 family peptidase n=1 Tax=Alteromonas ponticola TaxID=2720613 RepID=A0ABX1R4Z7_9ALTE|nr:M28 family peptidase [Alteromonas ponticola]NMH61519.1 M28 family peptidase [Alteromonas ponticola]
MPTDYQLTQAVQNLKILADDKMEGRKTGTPGHKIAAGFISDAFSAMQLGHFSPGYFQPFTYEQGWNEKTGVNVVGLIEGSEFADDYIVISAHYDHLGIKGRHIFNGADDNASGVAAMLALANYFTVHRPHHSIIFLATDVEEAGLRGAKAFLSSSPIKAVQIRLNINIDMIGNGGKRHELYVLTPPDVYFTPLVHQYIAAHSKATFRLKAGQPRKINRRSLLESRIDWRRASDHAVFANVGIDYIYFGNDIHKHYHQPSDTFENINVDFFKSSLVHITDLVSQLDRLNLRSRKVNSANE